MSTPTLSNAAKPRETGRTAPSRFTLAAAAFAILIGLFHLATLRDGIPPSSAQDFSLYLTQGLKVIQGRPYLEPNAADTAFHATEVATRPLFPPVFPIFLGLIHEIFQLNLLAMKVPLVLFFSGTIFLCYQAFRHRLSSYSSFCAIAGLGLFPYLFDFKEAIFSELPFLFFIMLWISVHGLIDRQDANLNRKSWLAAAAGIVQTLAYGTHFAALVLVPTILIYDIVKFRRIRWTTVLSLAVFALTAASLFAVVEQAHSIERLLSVGPQYGVSTIIGNLEAYRWALFEMWNNGFSGLLAQVTAHLMLLLAVIGFLLSTIRNWKTLTVFDVFVAAYAAIIVLRPAGTSAARDLIPLLPALFFYAFVTIERVFAHHARIAHTSTAALGTLIAINYAGAYASTDFGSIPEGPGKAAASEVFAYVKEHAEQGDDVVFQHPEITRTFADRTAKGVRRVERLPPQRRQIRCVTLGVFGSDAGECRVADVESVVLLGAVELRHAIRTTLFIRQDVRFFLADNPSIVAEVES